MAKKCTRAGTAFWGLCSTGNSTNLLNLTIQINGIYIDKNISKYEYAALKIL